MGVEGIRFVEGALDDLPPIRVACHGCLDRQYSRETCGICNGRGQLLAPWVEI